MIVRLAATPSTPIWYTGACMDLTGQQSLLARDLTERAMPARHGEVARTDVLCVPAAADMIRSGKVGGASAKQEHTCTEVYWNVAGNSTSARHIFIEVTIGTSLRCQDGLITRKDQGLQNRNFLQGDVLPIRMVAAGARFCSVLQNCCIP